LQRKEKCSGADLMRQAGPHEVRMALPWSLGETEMALRLHNKKWYPFIFLFGSAAILALWFYYAAGHRPELLLSGLGALAGFFYFIYRQHLDETKLFKELFVEFNERYDKLNEELNRILVGRQDGELSESERELVFSYFNLCAEEYFFYNAGYI
jgi:hypothetical protein